MSKRLNSSGSSMYQGKMKSCFGKKTSGVGDFAAYESGKQKHSKPKIQPRKAPGLQKKQSKQKPSLTLNGIVGQEEDGGNKGSSSGTQENIVIECIKEVQASIMIDSARKRTASPERRERTSYFKDDMIKNCDISNLKNLLCHDLNDCDFFSAQENMRNSSKRLLFMEYNNTELYINKSVEKSKAKDVVISKEIRETFKTRKSPDNYISINSRIHTEDTYDTSDPSAKAKMTPQGLTPRSIEDQGDSNRRNSFIYSQSVTLPLLSNQKPHKPQSELFEQFQPMQMQPQQQSPSLFFPQPYFWNGGYQSMNMSNYYSESNKGSKMADSDNRNYNIIISNIQEDGRTTLMIKNIPNKYTREMLIDLFDKTESKKYDFLYLPIDPDNSCNIGYAFINFLDCSFIKEFYQRFNGQKWECFNSQKICRLTYARMQGTSSLNEHIAFNAAKTRRRNGEEENVGEMYSIPDRQRQDHRK